MKTLIGCTLAILLAPGAGAQDAAKQDPPKLNHTSTDPWKCKACSIPLQKALAYVDKNGAQADGYTQFFMGFAYLASGRHPKEVQQAVQRISSGFYKQGGFNGNWATCMAGLFLAETYRRAPTEKVHKALVDLLKTAEENVEPTGGWCHNKGMAAETGYNKQGGGVDLGILTSMMYAGMLLMKKSGVAVPEKLLIGAEKNLETLSDGQGVGYGTDNRVGDTAMGRGCFAYLGIHETGHSGSKLAKTVPMGLKSRYKATDGGHAYPPFHFTSVAIASHLLGPETYDRFAGHWIDRLIALQKEDGSVKLPHTENGTLQERDNLVSPTATFALILLLQQPGAWERDRKPAEKKVSGGLGLGPKTATGAAKAWLGVRLSGAEVKEVAKGSPAEKAGLRAGDRLAEPDSVREGLSKAAPAQKLPVVVVRSGERTPLEATLGPRPAEAPAEEL